jgi:Na+/H+-translocating membrane pyrophosphatase
VTTTTSHRRLDVASLALLLVGLVFGVLAYWLITVRDVNALVLVPSIVAITTGASHIAKREAPRR